MKKWPAKLRTLRSCWPANFWKIRKRIWNIYTNHIPVYIGEKLSQVEGSPSQPSQLYRAFVWQKRLTHLTELTAGRLSSEFTQTFIFLQVLNNWLQHSTQHKFVSSSQTPILAPFFFLNYNACACSAVSLHLAKLPRVGEPKCIPAWQNVPR